MKREYKAWIIAGKFEAMWTLPARGPFPVYKEIGGMLPFFTTKRAAQSWCKARRMKVPGALGIHFVRVSVVASPESNS